MWDARSGHLFWIDIEGKALYRRSSGNGRVSRWKLSGMPGTVVPTQNENKVLLALDSGLTTFDVKSKKEICVFGFPEDTRRYRFNDGKCDTIGRLWVGSMHREAKKGQGSLYCVESPLLLGDATRKEGWSVRRVLDNLTIPNGIAWSANGKTMYLIDSPTRQIAAYEFDLAEGNIGKKRIAVKIPRGRGYPDGMTIDAEDMLWVAHWDGSCVARYNPKTGRTLQVIDVPTPKVTSCWFGGKDQSMLYITTAIGSSDGGKTDRRKYPLTGAVFQVETDVTGRHSPVFLTWPSG